MAKRDRATYRVGQGTTVTEDCVNLTFSVGLGGDNGPADIMLVQTLFNYIGVPRTRTVSPILGISAREMPAIDGTMGPKTQAAILAFQRINHRRLLAVDGKIEPAQYEGRVIAEPAGRLMTITWLDMKAREECLMRSDPNYFAALIRLAPKLAPWLA